MVKSWLLSSFVPLLQNWDYAKYFQSTAKYFLKALQSNFSRQCTSAKPLCLFIHVSEYNIIPWIELGLDFVLYLVYIVTCCKFYYIKVHNHCLTFVCDKQKLEPSVARICLQLPLMHLFYHFYNPEKLVKSDNTVPKKKKSFCSSKIYF